MSDNPYRELFVEFCNAELATGGPDPQVLLTAKALHGTEVDRVVQAGLFVVPYSCGSAAVLWGLYANRFSFDAWPAYLIEHKPGFPIRRERRSVWGDDRAKLMRSVTSWVKWAREVWPTVSAEPYDVVYKSIGKHCEFFGRYATMKVLEVLYQGGLITYAQDSIVPKGAKYPKRMLAMLFPDADVTFALSDNSDDAHTLKRANELAAEAASWLAGGVTWFQLETLLCNARQAHSGKYAGRSHDRELAHWRTANGHFTQAGNDLRKHFPFYALRSDLFPHQYLGEKGDPKWWTARPELEEQQKKVVANALANH